MTVARVRMWGSDIGAVSFDAVRRHAAFQYTPEFARSGLQISPLTLPLSDGVYEFPGLPERTFHGLPGLLADSLPDKFGNALIDAWLATQGRNPDSFDPVERLCYTGSRGMGALEYEPSLTGRPTPAKRIHVDRLVDLASRILSHRGALSASLGEGEDSETLAEILRIGTSAGGARAKAVVAWNPHTHEVRSGQVPADDGFEHWLLKFDGVSSNRDRELEDPQGYCTIEYAYSLMGKAAGITMEECRLLDENGRRHFMTRRFDRTRRGDKLHMVSLGALAHYDYNSPGAHSYEQAFQVMRRLGFGAPAIEEQFRRMAFNVVARNQDDHVKNIAFLMDKGGTWSLSPAFDVTYAYNPDGAWTSQHQMSVNGKRDDFAREDVEACARAASLKRGRAMALLAEVTASVRRFPEFAGVAGVDPKHASAIAQTHRCGLVK